jgi:hypothetical protein
VAAAPRLEVGPDPVHAPLDPLRVVPLDLVAHRVGQGLDRRRAVDAVAVPVEELVELSQWQRPVATEDAEARGSESATVEQIGVRRQRGQWTLVVVRRSPALLPRHDGPERVARIAQVAEQVTPLGRELLDTGIDLVQPVEPVEPAHVDPDPGAEWHPGDGTSRERRMLRSPRRRRRGRNLAVEQAV